MTTTSIKNFFLIVAKNALNAVLTNAALMTTMSGAFNMHSSDGWWNLGKATLSVIAAREVAVWVPVMLRWSATTADPAGAVTPAGGVNIPPKV
jgi:hypothetical protein